MLSQKQIENLQEEVYKIGEEKSKAANEKFKTDIVEIRHRYMFGQDGKISGSTTVYLKSGEIINI